MAATEELRIAAIPTDVEIDPVTLDIIEGALKSARYEMDAVLFRSAMSPVIREQHDEFPMLTDPRGRMVVGQFGAYINEMMEEWTRGIYPGDVILCADPFKCSASISHTNDWLVLVPIFFEDELVGWASQFGHMMDAGGPLPGALPTGAKTIFGEGIIIPPIKVVERGVVQEDVLGLILNNVRIPEMNRADLFAIIAGCRAGEARVMELCNRFGKRTYLAALQALLDRTYEAMKTLILLAIPETPQSFEDYVDDDGLGNGPFKMKLTIWREGEHAYFDWSGTDPQALGPVNFYLSEGMFKMFIGIYLIMVNDPQILFNDGFYPLLHVVMPEGSLLRPRFPAALGCRTHALARLFDVLGGALCKNAPDLNTAAGYGTSPYMLYSGWKESVDGMQPGEFFYSMEILYGGIPGRPIGDGMDGHSWWPLFENIPTEYLEAYYPMRIDGYTTVTDSGGAGLHRGGNGVEKRYVYLEPGEVSIHDDRWLTRPWGVLGGLPGERSSKLLVRADGSEQVLPSKCDEVEVQPGDMLVYRTAGGGGWKDRLDRPAETVARDVSFGLVSREFAQTGYGVVLAADGSVDECRHRGRAQPSAQRAWRRAGVRLRPIARRHARQLQGRDGPRAADDGHAAALVAARAGRRGAQARARCRRGGRRGLMDDAEFYRERGFGGTAGFGRRPALLVIDLVNGFTDPSSPLGSDLDAVVAATRRLIDACRPKGVPIVFTTVAFDGARSQAAAVFMAKIPSLRTLVAGSREVQIDERLGLQPSDTLITKQFASAFFGTALSSLLAAEGCDTVLVTGATTSGCVRASAVDAVQHGYRPIVPRECVGDRAQAPHEANLFDIQQKYGDVVALDDAIAAVAAL